MSTEETVVEDKTNVPPPAEQTQADKFYDGVKTPPVDPVVPPSEAPPVEPKKDEKAPVGDESKEEIKFDLKLPDGSSLGAEHLKGVEDYARTAGLTPEQAQKILERDSQLVASQLASQQQTFENLKSEWRSASLADKEIGGDNLKESVHFAKQAISRFGNETLEKILDETGAGNHPEFVRYFAKVGRAMANDKYEKATSAPAPKKSMEEILYGNPEGKQK